MDTPGRWKQIPEPYELISAPAVAERGDCRSRSSLPTCDTSRFRVEPRKAGVDSLAGSAARKRETNEISRPLSIYYGSFEDGK
jgi:hypothetical protein